MKSRLRKYAVLNSINYYSNSFQYHVYVELTQTVIKCGMNMMKEPALTEQQLCQDVVNIY